MLSLLRKISDDNDARRDEIASLRNEVDRCTTSLHDRLDNKVAELRIFVERTITDKFRTADKLWKRTIRDRIVHKLEVAETNLHDTVSDAIAEKLDGLEESLEEAVSTAVDGMGETLLEEMYDAVERSVHESVPEAISNELSGGELGEVVSEALTEALEDPESNLQQGINEISRQNRTLRSDIATVQHQIVASQCDSCGKDEFVLFPKLPPEIRLMVWKMVCFEPSIIKLCATWETDHTFGGFGCFGYRVPAVLHACRESRKEALEWYTQTSMEKSYTCISSGNKLQYCPKYFNFANDIFYIAVDEVWDFDFSWVAAIKGDPRYRQFRRIAVSRSVFDKLNVLEPDDLLSKPESEIEEVILVANGGRLAETKQKLVPAHVVPFWKNDGTPVADDHIYVHQYIHGAAYLTMHSDYLKDIMINFMDIDARYEYMVASGMSVQEAENYVRAGHEDNPSDTPEIIDAREKAKLAKYGKRCPKFTVMALEDVCPVSNIGMIMG